MKFLNPTSLPKAALILLLLNLFIFGCTDGELSDNDVYKAVQKHYTDDSFFSSPNITIKVNKEAFADYNALLVHITDKTYSLGFINKYSKRYTPFAEFNEVDGKLTQAAAWGVSLTKTNKGKPTKEMHELSIFYGMVADSGHHAIEIKWNCQTPETSNLIDGKYFLFIYPKHNYRVCNEIALIDKNGNKKSLSRR